MEWIGASWEGHTLDLSFWITETPDPSQIIYPSEFHSLVAFFHIFLLLLFSFYLFLGAFAWSRRVSVTSCTSVHTSICPSLRVYQRGPTRRIPIKFDIGGAFIKMCQENSNLVEIGQIVGHITRRSKYVLLLLATLNHHKSVLFEWKVIRLLE